MRVSKEQAAQNRQHILTAAARLFREHGINATGVDAITKDAGLTHGGLYSQFGSKEAIAVEGSAVRADAVKKHLAASSGAQARREGASQHCGRLSVTRPPGLPWSGLYHRRAWHQHRSTAAKRSPSFHSRARRRIRIPGSAPAGGYLFTPLRRCDCRICRHGWRADSRAGRERRGPFRSHTTSDDQTGHSTNQDAQTRATDERQMRSLNQTPTLGQFLTP